MARVSRPGMLALVVGTVGTSGRLLPSVGSIRARALAETGMAMSRPATIAAAASFERVKMVEGWKLALRLVTFDQTASLISRWMPPPLAFLCTPALNEPHIIVLQWFQGGPCNDVGRDAKLIQLAEIRLRILT
jgi:hypothetical protein